MIGRRAAVALLICLVALATRDAGRAGAATSNDRYGIFMMGNDGNPAWAPLMGLSWVIGPGPETPLPSGVRSLYGLPVNPVLDEATLRSLVARRPGAHWYVENEPNVPVPSQVDLATSVDRYARGLNYYARIFKGLDKGTKPLDPGARLLGPNILNWSFTCNGCGGYTSGEEWTRRMRDRYRALYSAEPPLDIWTIHSYDLDWLNLPQGNTARQIAQIQGLRAWLDGIPTLRTKPIWITEVGYHWGFPGLELRADGLVYPTGAFAADHLDGWIREVFGWLNANAQAMRLDRWFIVLSYTEWLEPWMGGTRWPGILTLDGPLAGVTINRHGRLYQQLAGVSSTPPKPTPRAAPAAEPARTGGAPPRSLPCALRPRPC